MSVKKPSITSIYRLTRNIAVWGRHSPQYLVVHFTGGLVDTPAGQLATYKSYLTAGSNAHYLVGAAGIWEMVDPETYYTRCSVGAACGKKNECNVKGWGPDTFALAGISCSHAGIAGHQNTISVEICSAKEGRKTCDPMDNGWYFKDDTYKKAVELCAWICDKWSIKIDHIIMHNQVTGKLCPAMWCNRLGAEAGFYKFREDVSYKLNEIDRPIVSPNPEPDKTATVTVDTGTYFYSRPRPDSARIGQAASPAAMPYTIEQNGFCCTDKGWVQK